MIDVYFMGMIIAGVIGGIIGYVRNRKKGGKEKLGQVLKWFLISLFFGAIGLIILLLIELANKNKNKNKMGGK